ncbi:MAG: MFS transporter [Candidatus Riflebacteria bacterium]|nr:MFS transporter [Candidatus Riflebacteria bacterium]
MARSIDERIVQMTFNNQDFERNAKQSINTLEKLNDAVDPNAFQSGLSAIERSAMRFDLDPITRSVQSITDSMGTFEQIALGALINIGQKASDLGIRLVKSLSIDQITNAWQKYADAIASQQTIMSAVAGKKNPITGEVYDIEGITDRIGKLQWYTDETSYNISQMTNAIGSFTSAGIDLDEATQAIVGISNACADAGVSTEKAGSAFDGFSKAIGSGYMSLSVWNNQLKTSGITNSERFKQSLIDAAVEVGTLRKEIDKTGKALYFTTSKGGGKSGLEVTIANIGDAFKKGQWATSEVIINALDSYSDTVDRIYDMVNRGEFDTASEAIASLTEEYTKAGKEIPKSLAAFMRAQEAISFEQAIQSVKDAVSSKWSRTFELLFGNYEEAKVLWTSLANEMWEWFASTGDVRNILLESWHESPSLISKINERIEILNKNASHGVDVSDFISQLEKEKTAVEELYAAIDSGDDKTIVDVWKKNREELSKYYSMIPDVTRWNQELGLSLNEIEALSNAIKKNVDTRTGYQIFIESITKGLENITNIINAFREAWSEVFAEIMPSHLIDITKSFENFIDFISLGESQLSQLKDMVKGFISPISVLANAIKILFTDFVVPLSREIRPIIKDILGLFEDVSDSLFKVSNTANSKGLIRFRSMLASIVKLLKPIIDILATVVHWVRELFSSIADGFSDSVKLNTANGPAAILGAFIDRLTKIFERIRDFVKGSSSIIDNLGNFVGKAWDFVQNTFLKLTKGLNSVIGESNLNIGGLVAWTMAIQKFFDIKWNNERIGGLANNFKVLKNIFAAPGKVLESIKTVFGTIKDSIGTIADYASGMWNEAFASSIRQVAYGMLAIAGAIWVIASINQGDLNKALKAIAGIGMVFGALLLFIDKLSRNKVKTLPTTGAGKMGIFSTINNFTQMFTVADTAVNIMAISLGMVAISGALKLISGIDPTQLMAGLTALSLMMLFVYKFIESINALEQRNITIKKGLFGQKTANSQTGGALKGIGGMVISMGIGLITIAGALKMLSSIPMAELWNGVAVVASIITAIGAFAVLVTKYSISDEKGKIFVNLGKSIIKIGAGLLVIAAAVKWLSTIPAEGMAIALSGISVLMVAIYLFMRGLSTIESGLTNNKSLNKISASMLIFGVALIAITTAVKKLSNINAEGLIASLGSIAILLTTIFIFMRGLSTIGGTDMLLISGAMAVFSASLIALSFAIQMISLIPINNLMSAIGAITALMIVIGGISTLVGNTGVGFLGLLAFAAVFASLGAAVMMVGIGIEKMLPLLMLLSTQAVEVGEGIQRVLVMAFESLLAIAPAFVEGLVTAILTFIPKMLEGIAYSVPYMIISMFAILVSFLNGVAEGIRDNAYAIGDALGNIAAALIEGLIEGLWALGTSFTHGLLDWITGNSQQEEIDQFFAERGESSGESMVDAQAQAISDNEKKVTDAAETMSENTKASLEDYLGYLGVGTNNVQGIINAVAPDSQNWQDTYNAYFAFGQMTTQATADGAKVQSPSKATYAIGKFIGQGLVNGILAMSEPIKKSGFDLGEQVVKAISTASDMADEILETGIDPVITPVLDLSNIANGASMLSSMLDSGASYNAAFAASSFGSLADKNQNSENLRGNNTFNINPTFNVNTHGQITRETVRSWSSWIVDDINEELGKRF